ncbi:HAD family hydrolase [Undibacterium fentianense]|uniref:HAD family hydrolase n=1 Tax=Undibacterium fentianense TaxID=2828728 RepID=A0A941E3G2_9BURK|nr:HAD family hydrolase [Undibacterium fentianense]MBR7799919.1 HAD family hydrolase [Undibacterium fentianense]
MTIKALIFDLDDTLWPVAPLIQNAERVLHSWMGEQSRSIVERYTIEKLRERRLALATTNPRFAYDLWALRHTLLQQVFAEFEFAGKFAQELADEGMQVFANARNQVNFFPDVLPALERLKHEFILGSISNGFADVKAIGLSNYFSVSLAAHTFGCAKPDPEIFRAMLGHLNLAPTEVMYIGDDLLLDVGGAKGVGMVGALVDRYDKHKTNNAHQVFQPDLIVKDLQELLHELT